MVMNGSCWNWEIGSLTFEISLLQYFLTRQFVLFIIFYFFMHYVVCHLGTLMDKIYVVTSQLCNKQLKVFYLWISDTILLIVDGETGKITVPEEQKS